MGSRLGSEHRLECSEAFALSEGPEGLATGGSALRVTTRELLDNDLALVRGEERPSKPIEFVQDEGRRALDWVGTTYAILQLVSARFIAVLSENGFTGWRTFPASLTLKDGSELEGYEGLAIMGRCGPIREDLSEQLTLPPPVPQGRSRPGLRGLCFEPESWDGSDLFMPEESAWMLATEPVINALEDAGITGVLFRRCSEIELPVLSGE